MRLAGKKALVTGAAGGIGWASARALAAEGADVALLDLRWPGFGGSGALQLQSLGHKAIEISCDVTDRLAVEAAIERTEKELGGLDFLVTAQFLVTVRCSPKLTSTAFKKLSMSPCGALSGPCAASPAT